MASSSFYRPLTASGPPSPLSPRPDDVDSEIGNDFAQSTAEFAIDSSSDDDNEAREGKSRTSRISRRVNRAAGQPQPRSDAYELQEWDADGGWKEVEGKEQEKEYDGEEEEVEEAYDGEGEAIRKKQRQRRKRRRLVGVDRASVESFELYTPDEERAVVRRLDRRVVLFVALLYMLSFLDRSNIGNAHIASMDADLQSIPPWDGWFPAAITAFYVSYIVFEPLAILWRLARPHVLASLLVGIWGLAASMQAVSPSYPVLVGLRVVLGAAEAGFTGIPYYLSFFFRRDELALRTAAFLAAAPLASSFSASLAWVVMRFAEKTPFAPWRLLFLVEGLPSVLAAVAAWSAVPDSPETAPFLTVRQRKIAGLRLRNERSPENAGGRVMIVGHDMEGSSSSSSSLSLSSSSSSSSSAHGHRPHFSTRDVLAPLADPVAWLFAVILLLANTAYASLPVFLPQILASMGHTSLVAQALAAPPFLVSAALVIAAAALSDRLRARAPLVVLLALLSGAGYLVLALAGPLHLNHSLRYAAVYPAAAGFFCVVALSLAWSINSQRGDARRGGAFALMQVIGQFGPLLGARLYPDDEGPYYERGMGVCAGAMGGVALLSAGLGMYMHLWNLRRAREEKKRENDDEYEEAEGLVAPRMGTMKRGFRYLV